MWRTHQWIVHISQFYDQSRKYVKIVLIIRVGFKNFLLQTQAVIIHSLFELYFKKHDNIVKFNNSIFSKYSDQCVIARIFFVLSKLICYHELLLVWLMTKWSPQSRLAKITWWSYLLKANKWQLNSWKMRSKCLVTILIKDMLGLEIAISDH